MGSEKQSNSPRHGHEETGQVEKTGLDQRDPHHGNLHHGGLEGIGMVSRMKMRGPPPLHLWNPPYCGEIDIRISSDGTWFHEGSPIGRKAMVELFSSILLCEEDKNFYLITPVEKVKIRVDDAPFVAVAMEVETRGTAEQVLRFTTNVGDQVTVDADTPLRFEVEPETQGLKPYVLVRGGLEALVSRAVTYDLVDLAETKVIDGQEIFGVMSDTTFFAIANADELGV